MDRWGELERIAAAVASEPAAAVDLDDVRRMIDVLDGACASLAGATRGLAEAVTAHHGLAESSRLTPSAMPDRQSIAWRLHCLASALSAAGTVAEAALEAADALQSTAPQAARLG
jgi:phage tail protein X